MKLPFLGLIACLVLLAIPASSGVYTFIYADGLSYMSTDPAACANCHTMRETFDDWSKSSHAKVATCVDCHLPHNFLGKWYTKSENGLMHSMAMTLGHFDNIRARPVSKNVALDNCLRCHGNTVNHFTNSIANSQEALDCTSCHRAIGHVH